MATIDDKATIARLIAGDGWDSPDDHDAPDNPPAIRITEYQTPEGRTAYGVVWRGDGDPFRYEQDTEYVRDPRLVWAKDDDDAVADDAVLPPRPNVDYETARRDLRDWVEVGDPEDEVQTDALLAAFEAAVLGRDRTTADGDGLEAAALAGPGADRLRDAAEAGQIEADLQTLRRSLPTVVVGPGTAELWLAFGRIERALAAGADRLDPERLAEAMNRFETRAAVSVIVATNPGTHRPDCVHVAEIAAEYERLSRSETP